MELSKDAPQNAPTDQIIFSQQTLLSILVITSEGLDKQDMRPVSVPVLPLQIPRRFPLKIPARVTYEIRSKGHVGTLLGLDQKTLPTEGIGKGKRSKIERPE